MDEIMPSGDNVEFLAQCVHETNRRTIAMMFVRLSVCVYVCLSVHLSFWDGRAL